VLVKRNAPDNGGSVITAYAIKIKQNDGVFSTVLSTCNGNSTTVVQGVQCTISSAILVAAPFSIPWNTKIYATVSASNFYGTSATSAVGEGATIVTVPNAPKNLMNNATVTTSTQIGFNWEAGDFDGGKPVISYTVNYDNATGVYVVLR